MLSTTRIFLRFCTSHIGAIKVRKQLDENYILDQSEERHLEKLFKYINISNKTTELQERSLAMQINIFEKLKNPLLSQQLKELITQKAYVILKLPTILKIFYIQKENLLVLDQETNHVLIENLLPQLKNKMFYGYSSDGYMMNQFLELVTDSGLYDQHFQDFLLEATLNQLKKWSLPNLIRQLHIVLQRKLENLEDYQDKIIQQIHQKVQTTSLYDIGYAATLYLQYNVDLKDWIEKALKVLQRKINKRPQSLQQLTHVQEYGRNSLLEYAEQSPQKQLIVEYLNVPRSKDIK